MEDRIPTGWVRLYNKLERQGDEHDVALTVIQGRPDDPVMKSQEPPPWLDHDMTWLWGGLDLRQDGPLESRRDKDHPRQIRRLFFLTGPKRARQQFIRLAREGARLIGASKNQPIEFANRLLDVAWGHRRELFKLWPRQGDFPVGIPLEGASTSPEPPSQDEQPGLLAQLARHFAETFISHKARLVCELEDAFHTSAGMLEHFCPEADDGAGQEAAQEDVAGRAHKDAVAGRAAEAETTATPEPVEGEWSRPMPKQRMMDALGIDSLKTFNKWADTHGLQKINRKTWQLRMDNLSEADKSRLRKA